MQIQSKVDSIVLNENRTGVGRAMFGFVGLLMIRLSFAPAVLGTMEGLVTSLIGAVIVLGAVNYRRELVLRRWEAQRTTSFLWPAAAVSTSLEHFAAVRVKTFEVQTAKRRGVTHRVHLVGEEADSVPAEFHCGSWALHDQARSAAIQIAQLLDVDFVDACSIEEETIEPDEHELTQTERIRKRREFKFPDRPKEMVTHIESNQRETRLRIPAPGAAAYNPKSWIVVGMLLVAFGIGLVPACIEKPEGWPFYLVLFFVPTAVLVYCVSRDAILYALNEDEIRIGDGDVTIEQRRPFGFSKTTVYDSANVESVSIRNSPSAPDGNVHLVDGRPPFLMLGSYPKIRLTTSAGVTDLGVGLAVDERLYVCAVIRAAVAKNTAEGSPTGRMSRTVVEV